MTSAEHAELCATLRRQFSLAESELAAGDIVETTPSHTTGHSIGLMVFGNEIELWAPSNMTDAEIAMYVADELQGLVLDELHGDPRPACPGHVHPLTAGVEDGTAWWKCPVTGQRTDLIWPSPP